MTSGACRSASRFLSWGEECLSKSPGKRKPLVFWFSHGFFCLVMLCEILGGMCFLVCFWLALSLELFHEVLISMLFALVSPREVYIWEMKLTSCRYFLHGRRSSKHMQTSAWPTLWPPSSFPKSFTSRKVYSVKTLRQVVSQVAC